MTIATISVRKLSCLIVTSFLCVVVRAHAQVDMKAIARLHFSVQEDSANWFEGFGRIVKGVDAPYASQRSAGAPAPAFVARTQGEETTIEWETAMLPSQPAGNTVMFIWSCGLGSNLGEGQFTLAFDEKHEFIFSTLRQPAWHVPGQAGSVLSFTAVFQNHLGAYFGYMTLAVPAAWVRPGHAAKIKITGIPAAKEIWYRTFAYTDALVHLRTRENKKVFSDLKFWNLGDAELVLFARAGKAGQKVEALAGNRRISADALRLESGLAAARLKIPREQQEEGNVPLHLKLNAEIVDSLAWHAITEKRIKAFLEEELIAERFVFQPGSLPGIHWKRPAMVDNELGKFELRTSYFDQQMNPVESAPTPGRYAAVVEGTTPAGFTVERYITLFCAPIDLDDYGDEVSIRLNPLPGLGIAPNLWRKYEKDFRAFSFGDLIFYLHTSADAAIFLAGLAEMDSVSHDYDSPRLRDRQWWIDFKRKQEGLDQKPRAFKPPQLLAEQLTPERIEPGNGASPYTQAHLERIRTVCREWARQGKEPFTALLAHQGRIVFHEPFGNRRDGTPMTVDTPTWMASITKLLTGILTMQFVDQGLLDLDAPVQKYLPELKPAEKTPLTLRHLLTHTHGGAWHGEWGSDWNPALENYIAQGLPYFEIGKNFQYNRLGYALAGKALERLSGRAVPYLIEQCLFNPLGMNQSSVDNTYGSLYSTCLDLSKLGQMLLQRGSYGAYRFFSQKSFQEMLPKPLQTINPKITKQWGIGTSPLGGNGLSDQTFGHEAASGAIFRIDPVQDLILIVGRDHPGASFDQYAARFIRACTEPLHKKRAQ